MLFFLGVILLVAACYILLVNNVSALEYIFEKYIDVKNEDIEIVSTQCYLRRLKKYKKSTFARQFLWEPTTDPLLIMRHLQHPEALDYTDSLLAEVHLGECYKRLLQAIVMAYMRHVFYTVRYWPILRYVPRNQKYEKYFQGWRGPLFAITKMQIAGDWSFGLPLPLLPYDTIPCLERDFGYFAALQELRKILQRRKNPAVVTIPTAPPFPFPIH